MVQRQRHLASLERLLATHPVVGILGARQVGKTTLATEFVRQRGPFHRFDLEDPDDRARLAEPKLALAPLAGTVVIDEVQLRPDLFTVLRVLVDRPGTETRFLILGSASPELLRQGSETLAGRIAYHRLDGFHLDEVGADGAEALWLRGGFPRAYLAPSDGASGDWRRAFVRTFLERDIPQLGLRIPAETLDRFWRMLAHLHAQLWNGAELARAFGISEPTVRRYLDLLTGTFVLHQLRPWHENVGKRQVRSPKVYIADSGLLHTLLGLETREALERHPKVGASWEGFVLQEIVSHLGARPEECFFWMTHAGAEVDLLVLRGRRRLGFEVKRTTRPATTRALHMARETLRLDACYVVHAGEHTFPLREGTTALSFGRLQQDLSPLA